MFTHPSKHQVQHAEELVPRTGRARLRLLRYRLRLAISEMNYATRRLVELQAPWISDGSVEPADAQTRGTPAQVIPGTATAAAAHTPRTA
jgi:hypothetical protein